MSIEQVYGSMTTVTGVQYSLPPPTVPDAVPLLLIVVQLLE